MQYRYLGSSDLHTSVIGLGCMSMGTDHHQNERLLHSALDHGINFFDTADLYDDGENEVSLGKAFKGRREEVIIATKVGNQLMPDGEGWEWNPSKSYIKSSVHDSLRRLQTDYIDLYQLHGGTIEDPIEETVEAFEELKQEGYIREYGISSIRPNTIRSWVDKSSMVSVMTQYSLLDRRPEEFTLDFLHQHGVGLIVRGALAKGFLIDKEPTDILGHSRAKILYIQQRLKEWSSPGMGPAQLALQFALSHPGVATIAAGASSIEQIKENAKAGQFSPSEELIGAMNEMTPALTYKQHR